MNTPVDLPPENAEAAADAASPDDATLRKIAHEAIDYLRHLLELFLSEVQIAKGSFARLLLAGALIPVFLLTIWSALNLLVAALVARWLHDWIFGYLAILVLNIALVVYFFVLARRWRRDLTLPRSRDALARLLERIR